jgi:hypothetical protein
MKQLLNRALIYKFKKSSCYHVYRESVMRKNYRSLSLYFFSVFKPIHQLFGMVGDAVLQGLQSNSIAFNL